VSTVKHDAYESGSVASHFDSVSDASTLMSIDTAVFKNGAASLKIAAGTVVARGDINFAAGKRTAAIRCWMRHHAFPSTAQQFLQFRGSSVNAAVRVTTTGVVSIIVGATSKNIALTATADTQYLLDMKVDYSASPFVLTVRVLDASGSVLVTDSVSEANTPQDLVSVRVGRNATTSFEVNFDDLLLDDDAANYPLGWDFTVPRVHAMAGC